MYLLAAVLTKCFNKNAPNSVQIVLTMEEGVSGNPAVMSFMQFPLINKGKLDI